MEGTLSWYRLPTGHVDELAKNGYERLTIVDIEVPLSVAVEQSKLRWWKGRHSDITKFDIQLGGPATRSVASRANSLHQRGRDDGLGPRRCRGQIRRADDAAALHVQHQNRLRYLPGRGVGGRRVVIHP
ncbi:MAG: hypothetical protein QOG19_1630 [Mycobacterium sp.]|nr:hypothetical protein [Mycobacterium sp.]